MRLRKVLYVAATSKGGSAFSLYNLLKGIDRFRYEPVVFFHLEEPHSIGMKIRELGIHVSTHKIRLPSASQSEMKRITCCRNNRLNIADRIRICYGKNASEAYLSARSCYQFFRHKAYMILPIYKIIRKCQIDLVHLNTGLSHGLPAIIAANIAGVPVVCHNRWFSTWSGFEKMFVRFVHYFIYISKAVAIHFDLLGVPSEKGVIIHNAVDIDEFKNEYDVTDIHREFGWTGKEHLVGIVGRLAWWKGHEYFLAAMARACQKDSSLRGLIIGDTLSSVRNSAYQEHITSMATSFGLEKKVIFTGFRDDVPRLMSALDIIIHCSSLPEPFGRVVIEGMAAGKPVVATAAGGVLDIIEDGVSGILVPCKDSKAIAQAINGLLSNPDSAKLMGLAARRRVAEKFALQDHVTAVQKVYDSVLSFSRLR